MERKRIARRGGGGVRKDKEEREGQGSGRKKESGRKVGGKK